MVLLSRVDLSRLCGVRGLRTEFMCLGWYYFSQRCLKKKEDGAAAPYTALPGDGYGTVAGADQSLNAPAISKPPLWCVFDVIVRFVVCAFFDVFV
jgi:hypothetical protein